MRKRQRSDVSDQMSGREKNKNTETEDGWMSEKSGIIKTEVSDQGSGVGERQRADEGGQMMEGYLSGKTVAIIGAGSIIGRRLAREAAGYGPKRLILVGHDENGLVKIQNELIENYPYPSCSG